MQPILMLAVVGVAAIALGTGFLGNEIELWIQQFGVGSGDIQTPTDHVQVDFLITQVPQQDPPGTFLNVADCELTLANAIGQPLGSLVNPNDVDANGDPLPGAALVDKLSELTCKFTDENGDIIAENTIRAAEFGIGPHVIPIGEDIRNIHDVVVVVHANTYNVGDFPP